MTTNQTIDGVPIKMLIDLSKPLIEDSDLHARVRARNELRDLLGNYGVWVASEPSVTCEQHLKVISGSEHPAPVSMCNCNQGRFPCNGKCAPTS